MLSLILLCFQVRDSLAQTLNTEIMDTIQKLDKIGKTEKTVFQKGGHVAHVTVSDPAQVMMIVMMMMMMTIMIIMTNRSTTARAPQASTAAWRGARVATAPSTTAGGRESSLRPRILTQPSAGPYRVRSSPV